MKTIDRALEILRSPGAAYVGTGHEVIGPFRDRDVRYYESGKLAASKISVPLGVRGIELEMYGEAAYHTSAVQKGLLVDVQIGDPVFDARFIIKGAPSDIVHASFADEHELRARILAIDGLQYLGISDGTCYLQLPTPPPDQLEGIFELLIDTALALEAGPAKADARARASLGRGGSAHREDSLVAQAALEERRARELEVARTAPRLGMFGILVIAVTCAIPILVVLMFVYLILR